MAAEQTGFARRSLLFMPGDSLRKMEKASTWEVDTIIMDLEDGVAQNRKADALSTVAEALLNLPFGGRERLVRLNHLDSGLAPREIATTIVGRPDGYILPKAEEPGDLLTLDQMLAIAEREQGLPERSLRLFVMIETALGVMNLRAIASATPRLEGLIFGAEDLMGDVGGVRTKAGWEVFYARSAVVTAAAAFRLQAFDMVYTDFNDSRGLAEESRFARQLGFWGKTCIHPNQTPVVNNAFLPTPQEVEQARRLVAAFDEQLAAGAGAFTFDDKMVDMPMLVAARKVLARVSG